MRAVLKGKIVDAVLYYGELEGSYPKWFKEDVLEGCYRDSTGTLLYRLTDETEVTVEFEDLIPFKSVFVKNKYGDIDHIKIDQFSRMYYEMGMHKAALKEDTIEYYIFIKDVDRFLVPWWIYELVVDEHIVMSKDVRSFYDETGEYAMSPTCIFIRNRLKEVKYLELDQFYKYYEFPYGYPLSEMWRIMTEEDELVDMEKEGGYTWINY